MMFPLKTILLTGASGLIGRYLMKDLLLQGHSLVVLSRRKGVYSAKDRIESIIKDWEDRLQRRLVRPHVVEGDIRNPFCGLELENSVGTKKILSLPRSVGTIDTILHSAASLRFEKDHTGEEPVRSNVEGARNAIALAEALGVSQYHHISTAYVCGKSGSAAVSPSDLEVGQAFQNIYEESKLQAEQLVHQASGISSKTIYRPSIVVGDSETGFTSTFSTIYSLIRFLRALPEHNAYDIPWILSRLQLTGNEGKNLVPVDWVSQRIADVINSPELHNQTIHLSSPIKVPGAIIRDAIIEAIEVEDVAWKSMATKSNLSQAINAVSDEAFDTYLDAYRGYLADDPNFTPSRPGPIGFWKDAPVLDRQAMVKLFTYAIRSRFRDTTPFPVPTNEADLPGMENPLPIQIWIDEFLGGNANSPKLDELDASAFQLRLSGFGGGNWKIARSKDASGVSNAVVHMSMDSWYDLLETTTSVTSLLEQGKLVLITDKAARTGVMTLLIELIEDSKERFTNYQEGDLPSVLPIDQHRKGGRRFA